MTARYDSGPRDAGSRGIALLAVLVALSLLLALAAPFLSSMGNGDQAARAAVDEKRVAWESASVRELLIAKAARSASAVDPTPASDGRDEYAAALEVPPGFEALTGDGTGAALLSGEVRDLQRLVDLDTASPLVLANLLGVAVRLRGEHAADATELLVDGPVDAFPESGLLICEREVIRYGRREGNRFLDLTRGLLAEAGFYPAQSLERVLADQALVLDFRCVAAVIWPHLHDGDLTTRRRYRHVEEVQRITELGWPGFTPAEIDRLAEHCTAVSLRENASRFGKAERVFDIRSDELDQPRLLLVKSDAALGAGRVVRLRSLDGRLSEYAFVWSSFADGDRGTFHLPEYDVVALLQPLSLPFEPLETVIEPLVPVPVNVNTASREVLAALFAQVRHRTAGVRRDDDHGVPTQPPCVSPGRAADLAERITLLRGDVPPDEVVLPAGLALPPDAAFATFTGWEDFTERFVRLAAAEAGSRQDLALLLTLYDVLQLGCPGSVEMGTAPIAFHSAPLVGYRAAALRRKLAGIEAARMERQGVAIALPGHRLLWEASSQQVIEEYLRLDRRTPWWQSWPINTGAILPGMRGTVPAVRTRAHLLAELFPDLGFGQPRFPDTGEAAGAIRPQPSVTPFAWDPAQALAHESFDLALHPEGRDVAQEGVYEIRNSGPRGGDVAVAQVQGHGSIAFPLTTHGGLTSRHAVQFWFKLDQLGEQTIYDLAAPDGEPDRNRISLEVREQELVFEVLDEAGVDPDPERSPAGVERSAGRWAVPLTDIELRADTWYHVGLSAHGNRPGQITMFVDGVPRGEPELRTTLEAPIDTWQPDTGAHWTEDRERYLPVRVASTEGFPEQGVLRIGLELFEYSSKDDATFFCRYVDSVGGRSARTALHEYVIRIPEDEEGNPREDLLKILGGNLEAFAPSHAAGTTVELYGYAAPVYPQIVLEVGSAALPEPVGAFAIARVVNDDDAEPIIITTQPAGNSLRIGKGLSETWTGDIALGDPETSPTFPPKAADELIAAAFPASGGYALLVQRRMRWGLDVAPTVLQEPVEVGGVEVIRYESRQGTTLRGVRRAMQIAMPFREDANGFFMAGPRIFVTEWAEWVQARGTSVNELPQWYPFVVPISLPFTGNVLADSELVEWVQLRQVNGDDADTEWVRYNAVLENRWIVRAEQPAWESLRYALTQQSVLDDIRVPRGGGDVSAWIREILKQPYAVPYDDGVHRIGYLDEVERRFPAVHAARGALRFRGDPTTGTSSHAFPAQAQILPVHRFEFDWDGYGVSAPRAGRNDRIALVQGTKREEGQVPGVEWHTVNWAVRHYGSDPVDPDSTTGRQPNDLRQRVGDWPFQLVGFKDPVRDVYLGAAVPSHDHELGLMDTRVLDRIVKFPSGELPAVDTDAARVGGPAGEGLPAMRGVVDEIACVARMALVRPLDSELTEDGAEFYVRPNATPTAAGVLVGHKPRQWADWGRREQFPETGGLLAIDGEILAYDSFDPSSGRIQVAQDGRGLLGTEPRAHGEGALVQFLEHVPAAILAAPVGSDDYDLEVRDLGGLPRAGGTLLVGRRELLHYTWTRGSSTLSMPRWLDPDDPNRRARGLLRGRYGTMPGTAQAGEAVIWFPFRYWDRFRERADDPELAHVQVTLDHGSVWFEGLRWTEEIPDEHVDLQCYVVIDERAPFTADPEADDWLWHFTDASPNDGFNRIGRHGSKIEARFVHVYRPGAFDPELFRAQAWKTAPTLKGWMLDYQGESRVVDERITAR